MAGVLAATAMGAIGGAGKGIASYGLDLMQQADRRELAAERQQDRLDLLTARQAGGGGAGGRAKPSVAEELSQLADMLLTGKGPGVLAMAGMEPGRAADFASMVGGNTPMTTTDLPADRFTNPDRQTEAMAGPQAAQMPKYSEGQGAQLAAEGFKALRRAVGLTDVAQADNIAKAESTEQTTSLVDRYVGGDVAAGRGVLAKAGRTTFGAAGDEMTGAVPKGSVAESTVAQNKAQANQANAAAGKYSAEAAKLSSETRGELAKGASKERLATMLNALNGFDKQAGMDLSPADKQDLNELRKEITQAMRGEVRNRDGGKGGQPAPAGGVARPQNKAEYDALPKGTLYVGQDGKTYRKK